LLKHANAWRKIQRQNFTKLDHLLDFLEFDTNLKKNILSNPSFPLNIPYRLAKKIKKNTINDPILKQFVPLEDEKITDPNFLADPVNDTAFCKSEKLLKKYKHRALLLCTSACAMHCRYCFRQNFPYEKKITEFQKELDIIKNDTTIYEVILSGGDPLSLGNLELRTLLNSINEIEHVKRIRFHTRFVIGIPERIDECLLESFQSISKQIFFIVHINHPVELDGDVLHYLKKIQKLGIPILTQTVLLRGINDSLDILKRLSEKLVDSGIIPYYLHDLDPVKGAKHFKVDEKKGTELIKRLREEVSGYGVFQYVREIPFKTSKTPLV